jgi:hypothetical protein
VNVGAVDSPNSKIAAATGLVEIFFDEFSSSQFLPRKSMSTLQSLPPEVCYIILENLQFRDLATAYAALPYTWRVTASRIAILWICAYLSNGYPHTACAFGSTGSHDWFNQLPHTTRFKYKDLSWSPHLGECPRTISIDGNSMSMMITPTSEQLQDVSSLWEFVGNGKGEPFEIKRITVWLDPPKGHEATGFVYLKYSIAGTPTSNPRIDNIVNNKHVSTKISNYLQLDEIFVSPLRPTQILLMNYAYKDSLLPIEWGCLLGTTIFAKIEFDIRHTDGYPRLRQNLPSVTWVTREFSVTWSLSSDLALALQTRKRDDNRKHQIVGLN